MKQRKIITHCDKCQAMEEVTTPDMSLQVGDYIDRHCSKEFCWGSQLVIGRRA